MITVTHVFRMTSPAQVSFKGIVATFLERGYEISASDPRAGILRATGFECVVDVTVTPLVMLVPQQSFATVEVRTKRAGFGMARAVLADMYNRLTPALAAVAPDGNYAVTKNFEANAANDNASWDTAAKVIGGTIAIGADIGGQVAREVGRNVDGYTPQDYKQERMIRRAMKD